MLGTGSRQRLARYQQVPSFAVSMSWGGISRGKSVAEAVRAATSAFRAASVPEAAASAEWLALAVFRENEGGRAVVRHDQTLPSSRKLEAFTDLCRRREEQRVPVQYLVGDWDFHNVNLRLRPPVLIPRPETEELVELVLGSDLGSGAGGREPGGVRVLDVGCGSGAILCALLKAQPAWYGVGLDVSEEAVKLSLENVELLELEERCAVEHFGVEDWPGMEFVYLHGGSTVVAQRRDRVSAPREEDGPVAALEDKRKERKMPVIEKKAVGKSRKKKGHNAEESDGNDEGGGDDSEELSSLEMRSGRKETESSKRSGSFFDVLVSNPPYIPSGDMATLPEEVGRHEDVRALAGGGEDGLDVIRSILSRAPSFVRSGGLVWMEVDPSQPKLIEEIHWPGLVYERTVEDVYGRDRFCCLRVL